MRLAMDSVVMDALRLRVEEEDGVAAFITAVTSSGRRHFDTCRSKTPGSGYEYIETPAGTPQMSGFHGNIDGNPESQVIRITYMDAGFNQGYCGRITRVDTEKDESVPIDPCFILRNASLPETLMASLPGQPLRSVIDNPLARPGYTITSIEALRDNLYIHFDGVVDEVTEMGQSRLADSDERR